jgi:hypothetical protein
MSRKQNIAAQKLLAEQALYQKQCSIWIRSLERNDSDIAAVIDLNRSLHAVKQAFIKNYDNEVLLLNIGQGIYRLSPDGSDHLVKPTMVPRRTSTTSPSKASLNATPDKATSHTDDPKDVKEITDHQQYIIQYPSISYDEISAEQQELCVDFLLRLKLRRKLLSRIIRRLNRIATSMDHIENSISSSSATNMPITDVVAPPGPPKYGDLRLHCDPESVKQFSELKQKQNAAWSRIAAAREQASLSSSSFLPTVDSLENVPAVPSSLDTAVITEEPTSHPEALESDKLSKSAPEPMAVKFEPKQGEEMEVQGSQEKVDETLVPLPTLDPAAVEPACTEQEEEFSANLELAETTMDTVPSTATEAAYDVAMPDVELTASAQMAGVDALNDAPSVPMDIDEVQEAPGKEEEEDLDVHDPLAADYAILKDFKDAYEKLVDIAVPPEESISTGGVPELHDLPPSNIRYSILLEQREEDYVAIKTGAGIGATHQSMSTKEREMEFHRWQANVLSRIPEQPTYAELGYEHRVFYSEERRERAMKRMEEQEAEKRSKKKPKREDDEERVELTDEPSSNDYFKKEGGVAEDSNEDSKEDDAIDETKTSGNGIDEVDVPDSVAEKEKGEADYEERENDEDDEKEDVDDDKKAEGIAEELKKENLEPKIVRPISLAAIPSFYEQDLKRIKLVQAELMSSSLRVHAMKRLEETTREFNQGTPDFSNRLLFVRACCELAYVSHNAIFCHFLFVSVEKLHGTGQSSNLFAKPDQSTSGSNPYPFSECSIGLCHSSSSCQKLLELGTP